MWCAMNTTLCLCVISEVLFADGVKRGVLPSVGEIQLCRNDCYHYNFYYSQGQAILLFLPLLTSCEGCHRYYYDYVLVLAGFL